MEFKKKYIGDRDFYRYVLAIAVPMILQNLINARHNSKFT